MSDLHDGLMALDAMSILEEMEGTAPTPEERNVSPSAPKKDPLDGGLMSPSDTLPELSDDVFNKVFLGESKKTTPETKKPEKIVTEEKHYTLTESEVNVLKEAMGILNRLTEATTVGCIGVNMAGPQEDPEGPKKKKKGKRSENATKGMKKVSNKPDNSSFLSYLGKVK